MRSIERCALLGRLRRRGSALFCTWRVNSWLVTSLLGSAAGCSASAPDPEAQAPPVEESTPLGLGSTAEDFLVVPCAEGRVRVSGDTPGLRGAFCIDAHEAPGFDQSHVDMSFESANAWCAERGARLCTELEWETACRGPERWRYPYGDRYRSTICVTEQAAALPAGRRNACRSSFGPYDMSGNAAEWVRSGVLKGGDARSDAFGARCGARSAPNEPDAPLLRAVRCCKDEGPVREDSR